MACPSIPNHVLAAPIGHAGGNNQIASLLRVPRPACAVTSSLCSSILWPRSLCSTSAAASATVRPFDACVIPAASTTALNTFFMSHPSMAARRGMCMPSTPRACRAVMLSRWTAAFSLYVFVRGLCLWFASRYCSRVTEFSWHV